MPFFWRKRRPRRQRPKKDRTSAETQEEAELGSAISEEDSSATESAHEPQQTEAGESPRRVGRQGRRKRFSTGKRSRRAGKKKKKASARPAKLKFEKGWRRSPIDYAAIAQDARNRDTKIYRPTHAFGNGKELRWHLHWMQRVAGNQINPVALKQGVFTLLATFGMAIPSWFVLVVADNGDTHGGLLFLMALVTGGILAGVPTYWIYGYLGGFWHTHIAVWSIRYGQDGQVESVFRVWASRLALLEKYEAIRGNDGRAGILDRVSYAKLYVPLESTAHNLRSVDDIYEMEADLNEMTGNAESSRYATIQYCLDSAEKCKNFHYTESGDVTWVDRWGIFIATGIILVMAVIIFAT